MPNRKEVGAVTYTVRVDKDVCISSGMCVANEPEAFRFDDDELSEPIDEGRAISGERLVEAAQNCPSGAIRVLLDGQPVEE